MFLYEKELNDKKNLKYQLERIFGLSKYKIKTLIATLGLNKDIKISKINTLFFNNFSESIQILINKKFNYFVEKELQHLKVLRFRLFKELGHYKSIRHSQFLPMNGQRTHTNAKTQKKKRG